MDASVHGDPAAGTAGKSQAPARLAPGGDRPRGESPARSVGGGRSTFLADPAPVHGLQDIFDNLSDGIILVQVPSERIVLWNLASTTLLDHSRAAAMRLHLRDILPGDGVPERVAASASHPAGTWPGHGQASMGASGRCADGSRRALEVHLCRIDETAGLERLVLLVVRETEPGVSSAGSASGLVADGSPEDGFASHGLRLAALEQQNRERAHALAALARDFNAALPLIRLQSEFIRRAIRPHEAGQGTLDSMSRLLHALHLRSQEALDSARFDLGELPIRFEPLDLAVMLRRDAPDFEVVAGARGVHLEVEGPKDGIHVRGDAVRLRQVLGILVNNAIAVARASGQVQLRLAAADPHTAGLLIAAVHRGGPAERNPASLSDLAFVHRIVLAHGGTLEPSQDAAASHRLLKLPLLADDTRDHAWSSQGERVAGRGPARAGRRERQP